MATHKKLMTIFSRMGLDNDARRDLIFGYTNGRTESTKDLSQSEIDDLCDTYSDMAFGTNEKEELRQKRSIVLKIATSVGIHDTENWSKFNGFMLNRSVLKKPLKSYTLEEMDALIQQFRGIEKNYNSSSHRAFSKAWWNEQKKMTGGGMNN